MLRSNSAARASHDGVPAGAPSPNLDEQAYARVKSMIVNGTLAAGERIVPEQLARNMAISRTPVLSALKRLFQEGLVDWQSRRGIYIRRLSKIALVQTFELREVLEGLAARRAATTVNAADVDRFAAIFDGIGLEETAQNRRRYMRHDYQFHAALLQAAGSPPLSQALDGLNIMASAFSGGLIRTIRQGMAEHEVILEALRCRDPERAESAMREHIRRSVDHLYQELEAEAQDSLDPPPYPRLGTNGSPRPPDRVAAPRRGRQKR